MNRPHMEQSGWWYCLASLVQEERDNLIHCLWLARFILPGSRNSCDSSSETHRSPKNTGSTPCLVCVCSECIHVCVHIKYFVCVHVCVFMWVCLCVNIPRRDSQRGGVWGGRFIVWGACRGVGEGFTVWEEGFTGCGGGAQGVGLTEYGMVLTKCLCRTGSFSFSSFISFLNAPPENTVIQFFHPWLVRI